MLQTPLKNGLKMTPFAHGTWSCTLQNMNTSQDFCHALHAACNTVWQQQNNIEVCIAQNAIDFANSLQLAGEINRVQQDVVMLDVGGYTHHLSKQSVARHRDSFFGGMFSDVFNTGDCTQSNFIDRDGEMFSAIAFYLRHGEWFCDFRNRRYIKDECAFYCLPSPNTSPHFVWVSHNVEQQVVQFAAEDGTSQRENLLISNDHTTFMDNYVSNSTSLYIVHGLRVLEYRYLDKEWIQHIKPLTIGRAIRQICATNDALYCVDYDYKLYEWQLGGTQEWIMISHRSVYTLSVSDNTPIMVVREAVLIYDTHTQLWSEVCIGPPFGFRRWWCVIVKDWVYACVDDDVLKCKVGGTVWKITSKRPASVYGAEFAHASKNALHVFVLGEHWRYEIESNGCLTAPVKINEFKGAWTCVGVRDEWLSRDFD